MRASLLRKSVFAIFVGASLATIAACSQQGDSDPRDLAGRDWPVVGGDLGNRRFSTLDQINTANIAQVGGAWVRELEGGAPLGEPIVLNGRLFVTTALVTHALDATSGDVLWSYELPAPVQGLYKGLGAGDGMVFVGLSNSRIVALKEDTGEEVWIGVIGDPDFDRPGQFISGGPDYVDGLVMSGLANGDYGIQGRIVALDAKTGEQAWRFDTVPFEGEGSETWPQDHDNWKPGGGGVWMNGAVDQDLGLIYFGVGNPIPQWGGETREGNNLYSDSIVALDIKTGELRWHFQTTHHDIWEADQGTPLVLYEAEVDGEKRQAIAVISTYGYLFQLDRATGAPIWPVEERPVPQHARQKTAPTQPFPIGGDNIGPDCVRADMIPSGFEALCVYDPVDFDTPNAMYPILSTRAAPMAYSPESKTFYATGAIWPYWLRRYADAKIFVSESYAPGTKYRGLIAAMHGPTNSLVYEYEVPYRTQQNGAGFIATAGGLLFHGETDGLFNAYDSDTGEKVWDFQTGATANKAAATYEVGGRQYVAVSSGAGVWAFKIGGTVAERDAPPTPPEGASFAGRIVPTDEVTVSPTIQDQGLEFVRETFDEYGISPRRIRVSVGDTVTWNNEGELEKTIAAQDGSWTTGPIAPGESGTVRFRELGTYTYIAEEYPFMLGQLIVEERSE